MRFFLGLFFVVCAILGILQLVNRDDYDPDWNNNCQYGATYTYPDGHTVTHSPDCK